MPTGSKHIDIYNKQLVPQQGWDQYFFRYLDEKVNAATRSAFLSAGVLSDKTIGLNSSANDTFSADITNASRGVDDTGHIMDLALAETEEIEDIAFENAIGITYYVGFRYQQIPSGIERNPRSSEPEYPYQLDTIGELGNPDSVTDNTTSIRLEIDGILEAGVDHSGRLVRVWLDNPVSPVDAVAYYDGVVEYDGNNYVEVPYTPTAGPLGQTAPTYPISITALDYWVLVRGLSWFRNTDISTDGNYVFLGTVQGSGAGTTPTVFDINGQIATFLISLQRAYYGNSTDTPAPGRSIWAHRWAVKIRQNGSSSYDQDQMNAPLVIDKQDDTCLITQGTVHIYGNENTLISHSMAFQSLNDGVGGNLQKLEAATILGNTITFTRPGVNLLAFADWFDFSVWVLIENTTGGLYDRLYLQGGGVTANTMVLNTLDLTNPAFPADTCQARVFFPMWGHFFQDFHSSSYSDMGGTYRMVPKSGDGLYLRMIGTPTGENKWLRAGCQEGSERNYFLNLLAGRVYMKGGGQRSFSDKYQSEVVGHAQFQSDKRSINSLSTDWQPTETYGEWGFDYRGGDFGKGYVGEIAGHQVAASFRQPLTVYDGGSQPLQVEEPFTTTANNVIDCTRVGFDNAMVPAYGSAGRSWVFVEIQFDTPDVKDGVYTVSSQVGGTSLSLQTIDGLNPNLPVSVTGIARFYGGAFFGTHDAQYGGNIGWVQTIVAPTPLSGGFRLIFDGEDNIASTAYRFGALIHGYGSTAQMWGVRDGGVMFARAITTRAWQAGHELTQWDEVDTALVNTDHVVSDLYTGALSQITKYDLDSISQTRYIEVISAGNWIKLNSGGGGLTGVGKAQNVHAGISTFQFGSNWNPSTTRGLTCQVAVGASANYTFKLDLPNGCTLQQLQLRCNPFLGTSGDANSMEVVVLRQASTPGSNWVEVARQRCSGGNVTAQTVTITSIGEVIANSSNVYAVRVEGSTPIAGSGQDEIHWCSAFFDISQIGSNFIYG